MSVARKAVCEGLNQIRTAIDDFDLRDKALLPDNRSHNASVRIIRNGLAVQCFNILEDFIKARTAEVLRDLSASHVAFTHLPEKLQLAATVDAVKAIAYQFRLRDKTTRIDYAQQYTAKIASTAMGAVELPEVAFFHSNSNIGKDQYRDALAAFAIDNPWNQVTGLCSRIGIAGMPSEKIFTSFAQRRHLAAHNANTAVSESDLLQSIIDAIGLTLAFDVLMTKAAAILIYLAAPPPSNYCTLSDHTAIPIRFLRANGNRFVEQKEGAKRATKIGTDIVQLRAAALSRTRQENGVLVEFDVSGRLCEWSM